MKVLHWPGLYLDPERGNPFDCIFIKEHIKSVSKYCDNRIVFISASAPIDSRIFDFRRSLEDDILVDRFYFKNIKPLFVTNLIVRVVIFIYFIRLIFVEKYRPDIIHIHFHHAALIAIGFCKLFNISMIITEHWTAFVGFPIVSNKRFEKARKVFSFAKHILPVSKHLLIGIEKKVSLDLASKSTIINNSVDIEEFFYKDRILQENEKRILIVARLSEQKDLHTFFNALGLVKQKHPDTSVKVTIIGKGDVSQYKLVLSESNVKQDVVFLGERDKIFIADEMRKSDILCLSSIAENSPSVIGEALCTGLPVVSTDVGGVSELINEANGILVPPKEPEKLSSAIYEALYVKAFNRQKISQVACNHFSYQSIGKQIFDVYQKVRNK